MKIFTASQLQEIDTYTIKNEPVSSIDLMERAAGKCVEWITSRFNNSYSFKIFCGPGNNGGDGLAIARLLAERNYTVDVNILRHSEKCSSDFLKNEERLKAFKKVKVVNVYCDEEVNFLHEKNELIIDAIFGTGLNKPIEGWMGKLIEKINLLRKPVISIDIPSGLFTEDNSANRKNPIVKASHTLTFHAPKLAFMFAENADFVGDFTVLDIQLNPRIINELASPYHYINNEEAKNIYHSRKKFSHKGTFGHALIVAGSYGKMGAAVLCAKSCLRGGAGLVTVHVPKLGYNVMQTALPEAMVSIDSNDTHTTDNIHLEKFNVVGIGPGLDTEKQTQNILKLLIQNSAGPMVIDADAINILAENKTWLSFVPTGSIYTPHPGEFVRLIGKTENEIARLKMQVDFAIKHHVIVVLKGGHTAIACPDGNIYFNSTGNPGMATAGSGDVLTGILTALLAQGYLPKQAAILGVYLHGIAGDIAAERTSEEAMIAGDIIESLGEAYLKLSQSGFPHPDPQSRERE